MVTYSTLVDPGTLGATFGTPATVVTRLTGTTDALAARAERLAKSDPGALAALVAALTELVGPGR